MARAPDERLKAALRENLKRRKGQARARAAADGERGKMGTPTDETPPDAPAASKVEDA